MKARTADAPCASSSCSSDKRTSSPLTKKSKALGGSAEPPQVLSSVHMFMQQEQCLQASRQSQSPKGVHEARTQAQEVVDYLR